jgi:hypothetical protein
MAIVGCYSVDLYCDYGNDAFGGGCPTNAKLTGLTGRNETDCIRPARRAGWTFARDRMKAWCPRCSKARAKPVTER